MNFTDYSYIFGMAFQIVAGFACLLASEFVVFGFIFIVFVITIIYYVGEVSKVLESDIEKW